MAFGMPTTRGSYDADQIANLKEQAAMDQARAQSQYYGQLAGTVQSFGPGRGTSGFGGGTSGSGSSLSSMSSTLPSVSSGAVPAGPGGMPTAPSVDASPNLQSYSEQLRYDPWAANRMQAGTQLAGQMGQASPSDIYQQKLAQMATGTFSPDDPSYQWRFQQGQQAAERSLAARGLLNSGNAALELQQYGQGAASQEYGAQFNRMLQGLAGTESAYDTQMGRLMQMAGVNIDPTAGGQLNVAQEQTGIDRGRLSLASQELANQYDLGYRGLGLQSQELGIKALAAQNAQSAAQWGNLFGGGGGGAAPEPTASWDAYFAARDAARPVGAGSFGLSSTGGYGAY
jgi:hypothetical protein